MDQASKNRNRIWLGLSALVILAINFLVYKIINKPADAGGDANLVYREIETPSKLLLNGYLGHFFKFKSLGNINWLILPILIYVLATLKSRARWEKMFVLIYLVSILFISAKGFFNSRYSMTMMPITMSVVLYFIADFIQRYELAKYKTWIVVFLIGLLSLNNLNYTLFSMNFSEDKEKTEKKIKTDRHYTIAVLKRKIHSAIKRMRILKKEASNGIQKKLNGLRILPPVTNDLRQMPTENVHFLVNNLPSFYYYTNQKGYYYWCDDDVYYMENGPRHLLEGRSPEETASWMRDSIHSNYILTFEPYDLYNPAFDQFIKEMCDTVIRDSQGFLILKLKERP